jgi:AbiV family abortive infection protein
VSDKAVTRPAPGKLRTYPHRSLTSGELSRAARACLENAEALLSDAELLLEHGRGARAMAIAATGFQEAGKGRVCLGLIEDDPSFARYKDWKAFWREMWTDHRGRGLEGISVSGERPKVQLEQFIQLAGQAKASELSETLESVRQLGLYVNVFEPYEPKAPADVVSPSATIRHARDLVRHFRIQLLEVRAHHDRLTIRWMARQLRSDLDRLSARKAAKA